DHRHQRSQAKPGTLKAEDSLIDSLEHTSVDGRIPYRVPPMGKKPQALCNAPLHARKKQDKRH
ncbi:MAG: hypothetical protein VXW84_12140, partial [Verrucomicrobiota bacterium]|nr:hypothetical protein [Verrucomicrobiota bacterium]